MHRLLAAWGLLIRAIAGEDEGSALLQLSDRSISFGDNDVSTAAASGLAWRGYASDAEGVAAMRLMIDRARAESLRFQEADLWAEAAEEELQELEEGLQRPASGYRAPEVLQKFTNVHLNCKGQMWNETNDKGRELFFKPRDYKGLQPNRGTCLQKKPWNPNGPYPEDNAGPLPVVVILTQPQWGAYYHFLIDSLPRLMHVKKLEPDLLENSSVKFHTGYTGPMAQGWARMLGLETEAGDRSRLIGGDWKVDLAIWPPGQFCTNMRPGDSKERDATYDMSQALQAPARASRAAVAAERGLGERPVLLVVRRRMNRMVKNWDEHLQALKGVFNDWSLVVFDEMDLPDSPTTCGLFQLASVVAGMHGAGFANLVCARPSTILLELQKDPHSPDFEYLSGQLGMEYVSMHTDIRSTDPKSIDVDLNALTDVAHRAKMLYVRKQHDPQGEQQRLAALDAAARALRRA